MAEHHHDNGRLTLATPDDSAPRRRSHRRSEAMVAAGVDLLRSTKLPAWAVVLLLCVGMICYTVYDSLAPLVRADDEAIRELVDQRVSKALDEQLADAVTERVGELLDKQLADRIEALLDDHGDVARIADERIAAYHEQLGCGPDLALLLRVLGPQSGLLDVQDLPNDLQLCMLLDARSRSKRGTP